MNYKILALLFFIVASFHDIDKKIFAGQVHYLRIPIQYWNHRIQMIKALGLNYISMYVFWNYHQQEPDKFDFQTQRKNITHFLELAKTNNMSVLIRPGPYVCSQFNMGGIPYWLLKTTQSLRTKDPYFLNRTNIYFNNLFNILKPYFGSVIKLLQVQNQYGYVGNDHQYILDLVNMWNQLQLPIPMYHADGSGSLARGHWPGANIGINNGLSDSGYQLAKNLQPNAYIFSSEIYPGWKTNWGDASFAKKSVQNTLDEFEWLLKNQHSFSMLMAHGGTNFQFFECIDIVTSYDFDAPITQHGSKGGPNGTKYDALRSLFAQYADWNIPSPPQQIPIGLIPVLNLKHYSSLQKIKSQWFKLQFQLKLKSNRVQKKYIGNWSFEDYYLPNGIGMYRFNITNGSISFEIDFSDIAVIFFNQKLVVAYNKTNKTKTNLTCQQQSCQIVIQILSQHHSDWAEGIDIRKGLYFIQTQTQIKQIEMKKLALNYAQILQLEYSEVTTEGGLFYDLNFSLSSTQIHDTYLDMSNYGYGYIWVNGYNLGRYWNKGPQYHYYCPGVWLKNQNRIIVLDLLPGSKPGQIKSSTNLQREELNNQFYI